MKNSIVPWVLRGSFLLTAGTKKQCKVVDVSSLESKYKKSRRKENQNVNERKHC